MIRNEDARNWIDKGKKFYKSRRFEEAIKCYTEAARLEPDNADTFNNWGNTLAHLAYIKQDESLFRKSFEKYERTANLNPEHNFVFNNWGNAFYNLAQMNQDDSLLWKASEKYAKAANLGLNYAYIFYNWGITLCILAKLKNKDEFLFLKELEIFEKTSEKINASNVFLIKGKLFFLLNQECKAKECFLNSKKDILEIFEVLNKEDQEAIVQTDIFYPLLDLDTNDGRFFKEKTKSISRSDSITEKKELDKYKKIYILSISIINKLHINNENEKLMAHYTSKTVSQKILFKYLKFRLNAVNYSNDPTEGEILLDYLFEENRKNVSTKKTLNTEYGVFAGCFTFNYDCLNQFRLYGKEEEKEGTGLSLVFRASFFSEYAKMATEQLDAENDDSSREKYALFRCMYIDPITQLVETVGHKEAYLFFRENKEKSDEEKGSDKNIEKKIEKYQKYISGIIKDVREKMKKLKELIQMLDNKAAIEELLINLRYLTKHIAFKEEQECRIVKIHRLDDEKAKIDTSEDFKQMYVEYGPFVSNHIEKIYFGPKALGIELFQDILIHKYEYVSCEQSTNPLA
jgi:tetratricopeptide (TPR) repeat protein